MKKILPIIITLGITGILILILVILGSQSDTSEVPDLAVGPKANDISVGPEDAKVVLVEYSDFECPACGSYYPLEKQLKEEYKEKSVRFIYRHFPLSQIHKYAQKAAEAAEAAEAQGKFWAMADKLFNNQKKLGRDNLIRYAEEIGLDKDRFIQELDDGIYRDKVLSDYNSGVQSGVPGTPSIFINGKYYDGSRNFQGMKDYIDKLLE